MYKIIFEGKLHDGKRKGEPPGTLYFNSRIVRIGATHVDSTGKSKKTRKGYSWSFFDSWNLNGVEIRYEKKCWQNIEGDISKLRGKLYLEGPKDKISKVEKKVMKLLA